MTETLYEMCSRMEEKLDTVWELVVKIKSRNSTMRKALRHIAAYGTEDEYPEILGQNDDSMAMAEIAQTALDEIK